MPQRHTILITGASGMLGIDLSQELCGDYEVMGADVIDRQPPTPRFFTCDITDKSFVEDLILRTRPEVVIHTAAWTDVDGCERDMEKAYRINADGAANVAYACKKADALLIYMSTDFVFDGRKRSSYTETDRTGPLSIYADSKLKGEAAIRKILKKYFILRTSWLYGKNGKNFVDTIIEKAKTEKLLKVVDDQTGSPTYTKDLAKAIHALLDTVLLKTVPPSASPLAGPRQARSAPGGEDRKSVFGIYHVSNAGGISWFEYALVILKLAGSKTALAPITSKELGRPARRPAMSVLDNSKFTRLTGYKMRPWNAALKEYITQERKVE